MSMRWYVVHAYSGYEKKVALAIQDRVQMHELQDRFGEILVPTEEVVEMRSWPEAYQRANVLPWLCSGADGSG